MSSIELSLVFPAHNEAVNIRETLQRALQVTSRLAGNAEIIVVDDGSTDETAAEVAAFEGVRLVQHPHNRGYGAALRSGFAAARGDWLFFTDADLQFDLAEMETLLEQAGQWDVVVGYRAPRKDPWIRRVNARAWGMLVGALFATGVRDINCAFKLLRRDVLEQIDVSSTGAFINTELLAGARRAGFSICEVPVSHYPRLHGVQSGNRPDVVVRAFWELMVLWGGLRRRAPSWRRRRGAIRSRA